MIVAWEGCVLEEKKLHALEVPPEKKTKKKPRWKKRNQSLSPCIIAWWE
jgi:hypothetical protein